MTSTTIIVPPELFAPAESSSFEGTYRLPVLKAGPDLYDFAEPLTWHVDITNTGDALLVTGTVEGVGRTACARCLEPFDVSIIGDVEGYFLLHQEEPSDEEEFDEEEFSFLNPDNTIDLVPLLQAAILIDLPLVPLCRDDCKGLCPDCGINLNEESCDCAEKRAAVDAADKAAANPFSVLQNLQFDEDADRGSAPVQPETSDAAVCPDDGALDDGDDDSEGEWGSAPLDGDATR